MDWSSIGGQAIGAPGAAGLKNPGTYGGWIDVAGRGTDDALWARRFGAGGLPRWVRW